MEQLDTGLDESLLLCRLKLAFGPCLTVPDVKLIPYKAKNRPLTNKIEQFFKDNIYWVAVSKRNLENIFFDECNVIFNYIGWQGRYCLAPLMIKLMYEGYLSNSDICSTLLSLFCRLDQKSDDKSMEFDEWIKLFGDEQKSCVCYVLELINRDPLKNDFYISDADLSLWCSVGTFER